MTEDDLRGNPLFETVRVGVEMESFVTSGPGKVLWEQAFQEEAACFEDFLKADPTNTGEMTRIQIRAKAARLFKEIVTSAVASGHVAEQQLESDEIVTD